MADGLGIMNLLLNLQDKYDEGQLPQGKQRSVLQRLTTFLMTPVEAAIVALKIASMGKEKNIIHQGRISKGVKHAAFSGDFQTSELERIAALKKMSLN